jgi:hypothetical protein
MPRHLMPSLLVPAVAFVVVAALAPLRVAAKEKPTPSAPAAGSAGSGQYFELRIYTAAPGKMEALHKRFREHTTRLFEKHGIKNVGYWTAVDEKHQGRLYFILAYPDQQSRDRMWTEGFAKDPEWVKVAQESQKDGKLVDSVEQVFLAPTDYSPIR